MIGNGCAFRVVARIDRVPGWLLVSEGVAVAFTSPLLFGQQDPVFGNLQAVAAENQPEFAYETRAFGRGIFVARVRDRFA